MAIRPKTVTKARGVGTAQAVRESDSESPAAAHKYVSFNAPEKTARIIGLAAQLEGSPSRTTVYRCCCPSPKTF